MHTPPMHPLSCDNFLYSLKTLPLVPLARADVLRRAGTGITQMPPGSTRRQHLGMQ